MMPGQSISYEKNTFEKASGKPLWSVTTNLIVVKYLKVRAFIIDFKQNVSHYMQTIWRSFLARTIMKPIKLSLFKQYILIILFLVCIYKYLIQSINQ